MWFVFFAALLLLIVCSVMYIRSYGKELTGNRKLFCHGMTAVLVLMGVADLIMNFGEFKGVFTIIGGTSALEFVLYMFLRKNKSRTLVFMGKVLLAAVLLELTYFQFPSYRIMTGDYEHTVLSLAEAEYISGSYNSVVGGVPVDSLAEVNLAYHNLDKKIGTVHVDVEFPDEKARQVSFYADMTEETGAYHRIGVIVSTLIADSVQSQDAMVQLAGVTGDARFRFKGVGENDCCIIKGIELNKPIPFDVMPIRMTIITVLVTFIYACIFSATMNCAYEKNKYFCRVASTWITILAVCLGIILVLQQIPRGGFLDRFKLTEGDQITEELVLAFEDGQFHLHAEPSEELLAMENPYDNGYRFYHEVEYLWDHVFYEGKYYSYYGIAPLLLFLPYHLITGYFFPEDIAVMLFTTGGLIFLSMIYTTIIRKWFIKISTGAYLSGLAMLLAGCGIWYSVGRPLFYEMSISAGFLCFSAAAYFFITSGIFEKEKANLPRIFLSSLLMGLSVMCRPTLAVYAVCGCIFYIMNTKKQGKGSIAKFLCCAFIPICALGLFQMYYNYARFGSIFEFGIKYSLTINDFTRTEFHFHNMFIGIYNFLLAPPSFGPDYPFVSADFSLLGLNSYFFKDAGTISGLVFLVLPVFGYFLGGRALRLIPDKKNRISALTVIGLVGLVMPFVIVCSVWESGYSARYMADFSWPVIIGAFMVLFLLYTKSENTQKKRVFTAVMGICCVYTLVVVGIEAYVFTFPMDSCPRYADILNRMIAFYK